jgi:hypothetical protein
MIFKRALSPFKATYYVHLNGIEICEAGVVVFFSPSERFAGLMENKTSVYMHKQLNG